MTLKSDTQSTMENFVNNYSSWVTEFKEHECKVYSQNGEDGVLLWIFANIGTINQPPRFVEFGVQGGQECNTRFLRQHLGWKGLMMDGSYENLTINLHRELVYGENINNLLTKYQTPSLIDLLSIDVDFDDYFIWKAILKAQHFQARVVVIEFNYAIPVNENRVVDPFQDSQRWTGTTHFGAGILALAALGRVHDYTLVYGEQNGVNLFFIQTSILKKFGVLHKVPSLAKLHISVPITHWAHRSETNKTRSWIWNDTVWV
ncbi:unnamed protein product [Adineta steineri]|uniref:Uncharacterized protein n=1 Tax=Adineta steineri TaxID=433720 RepID=A0A820DNM6_9BILA|nr:unnamed protein product [Adineta steineri]CAF4234334.1 unnamed protein product [Adineta steineri]